MEDRRPFHLPAAVPFGSRGPGHLDMKRLIERLRMVLETRPGQLPWNPEFGCELDDLLGEPLTVLAIDRARGRIEAAIQRWLPEVRVLETHLRVINDYDLGGGGHPRSLPIAEAAMVPFGVGGTLHVTLNVQTELGPASLRLTLPE